MVIDIGLLVIFTVSPFVFGRSRRCRVLIWNATGSGSAVPTSSGVAASTGGSGFATVWAAGAMGSPCSAIRGRAAATGALTARLGVASIIGTDCSWVLCRQYMMAKLTVKLTSIVRMMERGRNFATGAAPRQNRWGSLLGR